MPSWVQDEKTWEDAIKAFKKSYDREPKGDDYAIVTDIYKKMGGKIKESYQESLRNLAKEL